MTTDRAIHIINRYFELAPTADRDTYVAQFATEAVVEDDGTTRHGIDEIRAWRSEVPAVHYDVSSVATTDSGHDALVEISGDFPGSPVDLRFHFEFDTDGLIRRLVIGNQ